MSSGWYYGFSFYAAEDSMVSFVVIAVQCLCSPHWHSQGFFS